MLEWIIGLIEQHGYAAIVALMVFENLFPPVPSELVMRFAGFVAARGTLHPLGVVGAGMLGSLLGMLPWYLLGRRIGLARMERWTRRHGRWLACSPHELQRARGWFDRHGARAVFLGRMVPGPRTAVSLPAGIACMPAGRFLAWSAAGIVVWVAALTAVGHTLGARYGEALHVPNPMAQVLLAFAVALYVWRLVRLRHG